MAAFRSAFSKFKQTPAFNKYFKIYPNESDDIMMHRAKLSIIPTVLCFDYLCNSFPSNHSYTEKYLLRPVACMVPTFTIVPTMFVISPAAAACVLSYVGALQVLDS